MGKLHVLHSFVFSKKKKLEKSHFVLGQVFRGTNLTICICGELLLHKHGNKITHDFKSCTQVREGIYLSYSQREQLKSGEFVRTYVCMEKGGPLAPSGSAVQPTGLSCPFLSELLCVILPFS